MTWAFEKDGILTYKNNQGDWGELRRTAGPARIGDVTIPDGVPLTNEDVVGSLSENTEPVQIYAGWVKTDSFFRVGGNDYGPGQVFWWTGPRSQLGNGICAIANPWVDGFRGGGTDLKDGDPVKWEADNVAFGEKESKSMNHDGKDATELAKHITEMGDMSYLCTFLTYLTAEVGKMALNRSEDASQWFLLQAGRSLGCAADQVGAASNADVDEG